MPVLPVPGTGEYMSSCQYTELEWIATDELKEQLGCFKKPQILR